MTEQELLNRYNNLVSQGYDLNSKEIIELFKSRNACQSPKSTSQSTNRSNQSQNYSSRKQKSNTYTEKDLDDEYIQLIKSGKTPNSPEMIEHYKKRLQLRAEKISSNTKYTSNQNSSKTKANSNNQSAYKSSFDDSIKTKKSPCHFIIDTVSGDCTLLDSNYKVVDTTHSNPVFKFFFNRINLHKFKQLINADYSKYKQQCKAKKVKPDINIKKSIKNIKSYIWLCPDANYDILMLLRKHITRINPSTSHYLYACEKYLHELARLRNGNPENLPFDINIATPDGFTSSNHKYISKCIHRTNSTVQDYIRKNTSQTRASQTTTQGYKRAETTYSREQNYRTRNYGNPVRPDFCR